MEDYVSVLSHKKYRELKRKQSVHENRNRCNENHSRININGNEVSISNASNNTVDNEKKIDDDQLLNASDCEIELLEYSLKFQEGINNKILQWTLKNLDTLRLNVVTELLFLLREEGHTSLPQTAQTLLGTKHHRVLQVMTSNRETEGAYIICI